MGYTTYVYVRAHEYWLLSAFLPCFLKFPRSYLREEIGKKLLNALYIRVRVVRPFVCTNCVRVYTIERAYARAYICACTCIRVSLRLFTRINANAVSYMRMRAFAYVSSCGFNKNKKCICAQNISTLKRSLGSETFRMYYITNSNWKSDCSFRMPSLLYIQWPVCVNYVCYLECRRWTHCNGV